MKILLVLAFLGCGVVSCSSGDPAKTPVEDMRTRCKDGVNYIIFRETAGHSGFGYMSPKFNRDGTINTCE